MSSRLLFANVMHKRLFPKVNSFSYKVYYLAFDIDRMEELADRPWFGLDRAGVSSLHRKDHGPCDGSDLASWARTLLDEHVPGLDIRRIVLVAMPRILGYGFNPVSFWLCLDDADSLRAVICEVHNTFGERHVYLCRNEDHSAIERTNPIETMKTFHVSPFMERNGHYRFRFDYREDRFGVWIDYYHKDGRKQLLTSLTGSFVPNTQARRLAAFFTCPLVTLKTITMIHWQALKLVLKGIRYVPRPPQLDERVVVSPRITER